MPSYLVYCINIVSVLRKKIKNRDLYTKMLAENDAVATF